MENTMNTASISASLSSLRSDERNTFEAYNRAMSAYLATDTDHIEIPAHLFDATSEELASFHPLFALSNMRRARMETLASAWYAARAALQAHGTQYVLPYCSAFMAEVA